MKKMFALVLLFSTFLSIPAMAADHCKGKTPGSVTFFNQEVDRDKPLPTAVKELDFSGPMWALLCLPEAVGPQEAGGKKFRVVLLCQGR
jgi:hypothetical protein